jgi:hypothetical protein
LQTQAKYEVLLIDEDVARWVRNLERGSPGVNHSHSEHRSHIQILDRLRKRKPHRNQRFTKHHHELIDQGDSKLYLIAFAAFEYSPHGRRGAHIYMGDSFSFSKWKEIG